VDLHERMAALRKLKRLLDDAFRVPGTSLRFGWDPLIGLLPWVGDVVTALFSCAIIVQAHQMRLPRVVQLRMLFNVAIDVFVGVVPVVGDAIDFVWKSNSKNFALLERHAAAPRPPTAGDYLFVAAVIGAVLLTALIPVFVIYAFFHFVLHRGWF
jgi:hypothetical protein